MGLNAFFSFVSTDLYAVLPMLMMLMHFAGGGCWCVGGMLVGGIKYFQREGGGLMW